MIEEYFYLDEGHVKITAASVGISSKRWTSIGSEKINSDNFKKLMSDNRFDILPIVSNDGITKNFFKTLEPNNYNIISKETITYKDVLPLDTSIREVIKRFVIENRSFFFLTYQSRITGLITLGNLNCRQVQVYIFGLICELERKLSEFIEACLSKEEIENFVIEKSKENEKFSKIWNSFQDLVLIDLENRLIEHLFLIDFFELIRKFKLTEIIGYNTKDWEELTSINELRHLVAHPTRSLLDKNNNINRLWRRIERIEDLTFRLNLWRQSE